MATEPDTGQPVPVFNPRMNRWSEHFRVLENLVIDGQTPVGRASAQLLGMNRPLAIEIRREEALRGRYPDGA